jgi:hypothetical protein
MNKETISEYYLERYALGELPGEEQAEIHRLSSSIPEIQAELKRIEASNREILALYPPPTVKAGLLTQLENMREQSFPFKRILAIASTVSLLLILVLVFPLIKHKSPINPPGTKPDNILVKGIAPVDLSRTQLLVYRKIQDRVEIMADGEQAKAGDLLQLAYVTTQDSYGMILSIDGRGTVTLHLPESSGQPTKLKAGKQSLLPNAFELDDAPEFERFFFLTSDSPIDVDGVLEEAQNLAKIPEQVQHKSLDLSRDFKQYSVLIRKGEGS